MNKQCAKIEYRYVILSSKTKESKYISMDCIEWKPCMQQPRDVIVPPLFLPDYYLKLDKARHYFLCLKNTYTYNSDLIVPFYRIYRLKVLYEQAIDEILKEIEDDNN